MKALMTRLWRSEEGQDLAEYGIALAVIAAVIVAAATAISADVTTLWNTASGVLASL